MRAPLLVTLVVLMAAGAVAQVSFRGPTPPLTLYPSNDPTQPVVNTNAAQFVPTADVKVAGSDQNANIGLYGLCGGTFAENLRRANLLFPVGATGSFNNCLQPKYYIANVCNPSSVILDFPAGGLYPGTTTAAAAIPQAAYVCEICGVNGATTNCLQTSLLATGQAGLNPVVTNAGAHTCIDTVPGTCATYPNGPAGGFNVYSVDKWAIPRSLTITVAHDQQPVLQYPVLPVNLFRVFPLAGADGTYVFPADVTTIQAYSPSATRFGTAQFDYTCRSNGPSNSRAIICADGTNQNFFSSPLDYGFSPASRNAFTFMTYGIGTSRGLPNNFLNQVNPLRGDVPFLGMTTHHPEVYAQFTAAASADNVPLPAYPQQVYQGFKPVFSFDPFAYPTPDFVKIADTTGLPGQQVSAVANLINQGVNRLALVQNATAKWNANPPYNGQTSLFTSLQDMQARTFSGFYRGNQIGLYNGVYYGGYGVSQNGPAGVSESQVAQSIVQTPAWTGCFGPGPQVVNASLNAGSLQPYISAYRVSTPETLYPSASAFSPAGVFSDARYITSSGQAQTVAGTGISRLGLPGAPGTSAEFVWTCNDWTFYADSTQSSTSNVFGIVGNPGVTFYQAGSPSGPIPNQAYVFNWLSDNLKPQYCNLQNQNVYCSWFPTNTDGVKNGDETGIDCGGTTLGADNIGRPTPNCKCGPGQFFDYTYALCVPCIQDTYCNEPFGCQNECYPCFTAPTSGAALNNNNQAVWPNKYANPQPNNQNSLDQVAGVGATAPVPANPFVAQKTLSYGQAFNTNGQNVILVGTTFNQLTQKYDFQPTRCYCNVGFALGQSPTSSANGGSRGVRLNTPLFTQAPGWTVPYANSDAGFPTGGPYDGSNCVPVVRGDPQITGLQGQDFQVHGIPDEFFNMVSHPDLQVNAHFVYLEDAKCDNFTTCFSHAGTYIDQIGMNIAGERVKVLAGSLEEGLRVFVGETELKVGDKRQLKSGRVFFSQQRKVHVRTPLFSFAFLGTDKFMNEEVALLDGKLAKLGAPEVHVAAGEARPHSDIPLHGILGQTWLNAVYADGMFIEGAVADYRIEEAELFGNTFAFNKFKHE